MKVDAPWSPDASQLGVDRGPPPTDTTSRAAPRRWASGHCHQHLLACERKTGRLECGLPALKEEGPPAVCQARVWYQVARYTQASQHCGAGWHSAITVDRTRSRTVPSLISGNLGCRGCWVCQRSWPTRPSGLGVLGPITDTLEDSKSHTWNTIPVSLNPILLRGPLPSFPNAVAFAGVHRQPSGGSLTGL